MRCENNTVFYIQSEIELKENGNKKLKENGKNNESISSYDLDISENSSYQRKSVAEFKIYKDKIFDENFLVYKDKTPNLKNTYFYTASEKGKYFFVFEILNPNKKMVLIENKITSGAPNNPNIVSENDIEVNKAENILSNLITYIKGNIDLPDEEEEGEDEKYNYIVKKAVFIIFLKISATILTLALSSWLTKKFYSSQDLGSK